MRILVVVGVPDPETDSGNLALDLSVRLDVGEAPSEANGYLGRTVRAVEALGPTAIMLRSPVFRLGEILVTDGDRDALGRAPGKWSVTVEELPDVESAWARSREVQEAAEPPSFLRRD